MTRTTVLGSLAALVGVAAAPQPSAKVDWPNLPRRGFIIGRPASVNDVENGIAVFSLGETGRAAAQITVPQYALWSNSERKKHPVVVVQAELAPNGLTLLGLRDLAGHKTVATLPEVTLLGAEKPN